MSENTVNGALKRLGIDTQNELTGHGFRAMARTLLDEVHGNVSSDLHDTHGERGLRPARFPKKTQTTSKADIALA